MKLYDVLLEDKRNVKVAADEWQTIEDQTTFFISGQPTSTFDKFSVIGINVLSENYGEEKILPYTKPNPLDGL
jgi:hypothetical protein